MEDINEIEKMAEYCLNCKVKPCSKGCPLHTNIPEFIQKVKEKDYKEAYNILRENNCFSEICSLICPQETQCEGSCVRGIKGEPTKIGKLEEFVNNWAFENNYEYDYEIKNKNNKKVAIVGSGPSGLFCAFELLRNGFDVTVFEKEKNTGGVLRYGIPEFRLEKNKIDKVVSVISKMGCKFKFETILGKDITIDSLKKEFDAVYIAIGAEVPQTYSLTNENVTGIYMPDLFLKEFNCGKKIDNLGNVCVIGGGNVAIDCARCAAKMNAKSVSILYRRDEANMPATASEIEDALNDGVKIKYTTRVDKAVVSDGKITGVKCIKTQIIDKKAVDIENSEFEYPADTVIFAIGLKPNSNVISNEKIVLNDYGMIEIDDSGKTNIENVYAGGDVTESKSTACKALAAGKKVAYSIIKDLT